MIRLKFGTLLFRAAVGCLTAVSCICLATTPLSGSPWLPTTSAVESPGPNIPTPAEVPGKDFSDNRDRDAFGLGDPEQVIAWDGKGGTRDSFDFQGSRAYIEVKGPLEIDALGSKGDSLYHAVIADQAALLFSVGATAASGVGDSQIYFEAAHSFGPPPVPAGVWATPLPDIDDTNTVTDVDGLEVWGLDDKDDTDHYSVYGDPFVELFPAPSPPFKVAVWEYDDTNHVSTPAFLTTDLAASIDLQYGGPGDGDFWSQLVELMDVDAMMVQGDQLLFSIAPVTVHGPNGPLAVFDGGEIFVYAGAGAATKFLLHAGHLWDTSFDVVGTFGQLGVNSENINALEAIATPEPTTLGLALIGLVGLLRRRQH